MEPEGNIAVNKSDIRIFVMQPDAEYDVDIAEVNGIEETLILDKHGKYKYIVTDVTANSAIHVTFKRSDKDIDKDMEVPIEEDTMQMMSFAHRFTMESLDDDVYMWKYDPTDDDYKKYESGWEVEPGKSYWFFARDRMDLKYDGEPVSRDWKIEVELEKGWNMIASPNDDYRWDNVQVLQYDNDGDVISSPKPISSSSDDLLDRRLWRWINDEGEYVFYAPESYTVSDELEEYRDDSDPLLKSEKGYWVQVNEENVSLIFPAEGRLKLSDSGTLTTHYERTGQTDGSSGLPPAPPQVDDSTDEDEDADEDSGSADDTSCFIGAAYDSSVQFSSIAAFVISVFLFLAGVAAAVSFGKR